MARQTQETWKYPKTILLAIDAPYNKTKDIESYFEEFKNLAKSNKVEYTHFIPIKIRVIDPAMFITKGKLEKIQELCSKEGIEEIIISEPLTVKQERNLSDFLNCNIIDRTQLILEIFDKAAVSAEGKLQVEIALLKHLKSRVAGRGVEYAQQFGFIGTRGPGETAKEKELRHVEEHIQKLRKKLQALEKVRETQRKKRITANVPQICLVGYTNAGKSTILNALTKSTVLAEDKLFATLDTTTRELYINSKKKGVLSDTVGFIQQLPTHLINAFKSTLSELQYADLLLHVVDLSDKNWESQIKVVHEILEDLEVDAQMLYVFNKIDKVLNLKELHELIERKYNPHVLISAQPSHKAFTPKEPSASADATKSKDGLMPLINWLDNWEKEN